MIKAANKKVLCKSFENRGVEVQRVGIVLSIRQHTGLAETVVLYPDAEGDYPPGTKLWLRGDAGVVLATQRVAIEDGGELKEVTIVPKEMVVAFELPPEKRPEELVTRRHVSKSLTEGPDLSDFLDPRLGL